MGNFFNWKNWAEETRGDLGYLDTNSPRQHYSAYRPCKVRVLYSHQQLWYLHLQKLVSLFRLNSKNKNLARGSFLLEKLGRRNSKVI